MRHPACALALAAAALHSMPTVSSASPPVHECDRLAASPYDREAVVKDRDHRADIGAEAKAACEAAIAAHPGVARFEYQLGRALLHAATSDAEFASAIAMLKRAAARGHTMAMTEIGEHYMTHGSIPDYAEAARWLTKALEGGDDGAAHNLGVLYFGGQGVDEDHGVALGLFRRAA
ncbi:MAG TPA: hypothetical protein PK264_17335, partial [Hyphomicrobiaceae bacterium]|nr:hypothetical protein [Hyphomicrobiaceae bacterium]